jgi:hypothetical protein
MSTVKTAKELHALDTIIVASEVSGEIERVIMPNKVVFGADHPEFHLGIQVLGPIELESRDAPAPNTGKLYNTDGTLYFAGERIGAITVEEEDANPSVAQVTKIKVSNGTLTDNGDNSVTITGTKVNNDTENYITTVSATANQLDGEVNLTFDGSTLTCNAAAVFNENSADKDFRVETNGASHMLFIDGGNDRAGINNSAPKVALDVVYDYATSTFENQLSDNQGGGHIIKYGSGTLTAGKLYYLHTTAAWTITDSDAESSGGYQLIGIALGSSPTSNGVLLRGYIKISSDFVNGTAAIGKPVYVDNGTAGEYNFTAPSGTSDFIRIVGYCIDTDSSDILLYFDPDKTWIVRA